MLLLAYFVGLFAFLALLRRLYSPALLLTLIYGLSLACAVYIGIGVRVTSLFDAWNLFFVAFILSFSILPWSGFRFQTAIAQPDPRKLRHLTMTLLCINGVAFILFASSFYYAFTTVTDYESFKNNPEDAVIPISFNHQLYVAAIYLHSTAYFLVPLHLYYFTKKRYIASAACFLGSLNIALFGLTAISRSGIVEYAFVYALYFPFFYQAMSSGLRRVVRVCAAIALGLTALLFTAISVNRFERHTSPTVKLAGESVVTNRTIASYLDYVAQWSRNGSEVMAAYSFETLNGELSFPIVPIVARKLGMIDYPHGTIERKQERMWGDHYFTFNGLVANLLYDFGFVGTMWVAMLYAGVLRLLQPRRRRMRFNTLLVLGALFVVPAMGIFNSHLKSVVYNTLLLYAVGVYVYMRRSASATSRAASTSYFAVPPTAVAASPGRPQRLGRATLQGRLNGNL